MTGSTQPTQARITRVAVANRGEAAMRFLRTARSWSGRHRTPLETVALYTYADEGGALREESPAGPDCVALRFTEQLHEA